MVAVVNVLKAQKLYLKLLECAMNQRTMTFKKAHGILHGEDHRDSDESEVDETNIIVNYIATMCREQRLPRLTALITSARSGISGAGFWRNLGVTGADVEISESSRLSMHQLFVDECYRYYAGYCAHNPDIQQWVWDRVGAALRMETLEGDFISQVVREYAQTIAQASTDLDQVQISARNPLEIGHVHKEFFLRMQEWLQKATHLNDQGVFVWDIVFLEKSAKRMRREFTITIPLGSELNLYALTLAKELTDNEKFFAVMDTIEVLSVCNMASAELGIQQVPVSNGEFVKSVLSDHRSMACQGQVGDQTIGALAGPATCNLKLGVLAGYTHATVRVSFRLN